MSTLNTSDTMNQVGNRRRHKNAICRSIAIGGLERLTLTICMTALATITLSAQTTRWEVGIPHPDADRGSKALFSGQFLSQIPGGDLILLGDGTADSRIGTLVVRLSASDGEVRWTREVTDTDSSINPGLPGLPQDIRVYPIAAYPLENGELQLAARAYAPGERDASLYLMRLDADGHPLDTLAGIRDTMGLGSTIAPWVRLPNGRFRVADHANVPVADSGYPIYLFGTSKNGRIEGVAGRGIRTLIPNPHADPFVRRVPFDGVVAPDGDVVFWGSMSGIVEDSIYQAPFLLKVDDDLEMNWFSADVSPAAPDGLAVAIDTMPGGGYVGTYYSHVWVAPGQGRPQATRSVVAWFDKRGRMTGHFVIDTTGPNQRWQTTCIHATDSGTVYVGGFLGSYSGGESPSPLPETEDMFLAEFSRTGDLRSFTVWERPETRDRIEAVYGLPDGDVVVAGRRGLELYVARVKPEISSVRDGSGRADVLDLTARPDR